MVFVYALCEPGTRTVRYIGKTANLKKRFQEHTATSSRKRNHLGNWLRSLMGVPPNMVTLREVPEAEGSAAEIKYIRIARRSLGMNLVNATDGGEGAVGSVRSAESRAKLSVSKMGEKNPMFGKCRSPEHRARQSAAMTGKQGSPESRVKQSAAWTPERRAKHRAAMIGENNHFFGKCHPEETRVKQGAGKAGKHASAEARANMRAAHARRRALKESPLTTPGAKGNLI